ncbi:MAG TPA: SDR family oxidoreductase [Acidimicrobiales bacterium]|nr:SDR family oxidoreductase [Acidimicrobiales bacterium]
MTEDGRLRKSVVVTGAANGIGKAIVKRLAATGWAVVSVDRDVDALQEQEGAGQTSGAAVAGDVRDREVLIEARRAAEGVGQLTAWVNNAGIVRLGPLHLMLPEVIDETLDIDLRAVVFGTREALTSFLANGVGGSIVNISSVHARGSFPGYGAYDAAKGGVESLTRYVCTEYGHLGIRCNAIAPGAVNTNIVPPATPDDPLAASSVRGADLSPMHRVSEPTEIAEVVAFLVEGPSFAINGHTLAVDNGMSARNYAVEPDTAVAFAAEPSKP